MATVTLDDALIAIYGDFDTPADQFIGNPALAEEFAGKLRNRLGDASLDLQAIMLRLVYLRKRGRLPRLRRSYSGRHVNN
jgi:hypothetical protein